MARKAVLSVMFLLAMLLSGCFDLGGKNEEEEKAGNDDDGNSVYDLSLSTGGRFLVRGAIDPDDADGLIRTVRVLDLTTGDTVTISFAQEQHVYKMVFGKEGFAYFLTLNTDHMDLEEYDLLSGEKIRSWAVPGVGILAGLAVNADQTKIALWDGYDVTVVDTVAEAVYHVIRENTIRDVKWMPDAAGLAAVETIGFMEAAVTFFSPVLKVEKTIDIPNCSSSLEIAPDGKTAMLSPTFCNKDPVSVIDLEGREFVENLPGFGPVAFAPDGSYAVAFARQADLEEVAGITTQTAYSILFIDMGDLSYKVVELGADLPIYTITPDGELVLLYTKDASDEYEGIIVIDVANEEVRATEGPSVDLDEFVMTPDSKSVFLLHNRGFYRLDTAALTVSELTLDCGTHFTDPADCVADHIMIVPDGSQVILGFTSEVDFALYDPANYRITDILTMR